MATEPTTIVHRSVAQGTLSLRGPAHLLEQPSEEEMRRAIAGMEGLETFAQHHAERQRRAGYIETWLQLEFLCSDPGISGNLHSFAFARGVTVIATPKSRRRRIL